MIKRIGIYVCVVAVTVLLASVSASASDILTIYGKQRLPEETIEASPYHKGFQSGVSQQNLLNLKREKALSLPHAALDADETVTIKICAIRVQFKYEDPDNPNTTGRGHFDFRTQEEFQAQERHPIDMSPHNRTYFDAHLRALERYWNVVSKGRVEFEWDIFPTIEDSVYELSETMGHYGSQAPEFGLGEFFVESFTIADQDTEINFSEYDVYMVFHAGADQQQDTGFPPTPEDLYTGFIILGPTLIVDQDAGDPIQIKEGVMMPETASQDNKVVALNGVFAHEFGHQLGLVDLYDTRTFMTQIGDFSLMDNQGRGTAADLGFERSSLVLDVLPVMPEAWSRAYLGFVDVVEVTNVSDFDVWAAEILTDQPQVLKVPISDYEYYLIENRQVDSDRDDSTNLRIDSTTGVILGPAPADPEDMRYLTRDYDFFLPGSGILIWHIDETRAYLNYGDAPVGNNFTNNRLQWYNYYPVIDDTVWENRRFLSVVEADGIIDFGGNYRTRFGSPADFFYRGNNSSFLPTTNPSTRSKSGAYTGIRIFDISPVDTVMQVTVRIESRVKGFPKFTNESRFPPVLAHLDRDGQEEVIVAGRNHLLAMELDGSPLIEPLPGQAVLDSVFILDGADPSDALNDEVMPGGYMIKGGRYVRDTLRTVASLSVGEFTTAPVVADFDDDGVFDAAVGTSAGNVEIWSLSDDDRDGFADHYRTIETGRTLDVTAIVSYSRGDSGGRGLLCSTEDGVLYDIDVEAGAFSSGETGEIIDFAVDNVSGEIYMLADPSGWRSSSAILDRDGDLVHDLGGHTYVSFTAADLDGENGVDFAALRSDGYMCMLRSISDSEYSFDVFNIHVDDSLAGGVVTASLDPTLTDYQVIFGGSNMLHVYNHNGTQFENFPQKIDIHKSAGLVTTNPLVADVSGDGAPDIIIGTESGEVFAYSADGVQVADFPKFSGSNAYVSGAIIEGSSPNNYAGKVLVSNADNRMYMLPVLSRPVDAERKWTQSGRNSVGANFRGRSTLSPESPAGDGLIVSLYNYPNPAAEKTNIRYRLRSEAAVNIQIFDLSGRLIYEDDSVGDETPSEFVWTLDGLPPGIYICRMEATGDGLNDVKTHKIAVVR